MLRKIPLFLSVAALCACEPAKTQDYYMSHPNEIAATLAACKQEGKNTFDCNEAAKAEILLKQQKH